MRWEDDGGGVLQVLQVLHIGKLVGGWQVLQVLHIGG
jgi:hypothetical protein